MLCKPRFTLYACVVKVLVQQGDYREPSVYNEEDSRGFLQKKCIYFLIIIILYSRLLNVLFFFDVVQWVLSLLNIGRIIVNNF